MGAVVQGVPRVGIIPCTHESVSAGGEAVLSRNLAPLKAGDETLTLSIDEHDQYECSAAVKSKFFESVLVTVSSVFS